jgi:hypothetical protein
MRIWRIEMGKIVGGPPEKFIMLEKYDCGCLSASFGMFFITWLSNQCKSV